MKTVTEQMLDAADLTPQDRDLAYYVAHMVAENRKGSEIPPQVRTVSLIVRMAGVHPHLIYGPGGIPHFAAFCGAVQQILLDRYQEGS